MRFTTKDGASAAKEPFWHFRRILDLAALVLQSFSLFECLQSFSVSVALVQRHV